MSKAKVAKSKLFNTFQHILENALKAFYYFKTSNSKGNRMSTSVERKGNQLFIANLTIMKLEEKHETCLKCVFN